MSGIYVSSCIQLHLVIVGGASTSLGPSVLDVPTDVLVCNHTGCTGDWGLHTYSTQKLRFESMLKGWIPACVLGVGLGVLSPVEMNDLLVFYENQTIIESLFHIFSLWMRCLNDEVYRVQKKSWRCPMRVQGFYQAVSLTDQSDESHCDWDLLPHQVLMFTGDVQCSNWAQRPSVV